MQITIQEVETLIAGFIGAVALVLHFVPASTKVGKVLTWIEAHGPGIEAALADLAKPPAPPASK